MTPKDFGILADAIKTYFPKDNVLPTEKAMRLWYEELKDIPYDIAKMALRKYVSTNKFAPSIADIRGQAAELSERGEEFNETSAWAIVLKAIRNSGYHAEDEFAKLPPILQRTVHSPGQLREWAMLEDVDGKALVVLQSNFQRTYRAEQERERELRKLSPDLLGLMRKDNEPERIVQSSPKPLTIAEERKAMFDKSAPPPNGMWEKVRKSWNKGDEHYNE